MGSYLDQILERTSLRVEEEMKSRSYNDLEREVAASSPARDFAEAMREPGMSLIAEIKRRSPSAGAIRSGVDAADLAAKYQDGGARAISVLTEPYFFDGSLADLEAARTAVDVPVLRKDFLIHPYQVVQARVSGADAVLLIVAAHPDKGLFRELAAAARSYGIEALIEIHDPYELDQAFDSEPAVVGVNQRDLSNFKVDKELAVRLRSEIPKDVAMVAESGIESREDVEELERAGIDGMLIGETLMRADVPEEAVRRLLGREAVQDA